MQHKGVHRCSFARALSWNSSIPLLNVHVSGMPRMPRAVPRTRLGRLATVVMVMKTSRRLNAQRGTKHGDAMPRYGSGCTQRAPCGGSWRLRARLVVARRGTSTPAARAEMAEWGGLGREGGGRGGRNVGVWGANGGSNNPFPFPFRVVSLGPSDNKGQGPGLVNVLWAERKTTSFKYNSLTRLHLPHQNLLLSIYTHHVLLVRCDKVRNLWLQRLYDGTFFLAWHVFGAVARRIAAVAQRKLPTFSCPIRPYSGGELSANAISQLVVELLCALCTICNAIFDAGCAVCSAPPDLPTPQQPQPPPIGTTGQQMHAASNVSDAT